MINTRKPLSIDEWTNRATAHTKLVGHYADTFVKRRGLGQKHAVQDFLFTYYSCSPTKLKQWMPSFEEVLSVSHESLDNHPWLINNYWCSQDGDLFQLNVDRIHENTRGLAKFVVEMCQNVLNRTPRFGCFGLHEWAMVYKLPPETIRHNGHKLRLSATELANFVESQTICCSHYDAYRFFTKEAHSFNTLNPTLDTRLQMEQGGCLHANMDIYKWATKLWPWVGSEFIAKAFLLALEGRELDMRASPYDLSEEGYLPICIETEAGRKRYQEEQQEYTKKSIPLRQELLAICERLVEASNSNKL